LQCPSCFSGHLVRRRRNWRQRLTCSAVYQCEDCLQYHELSRLRHWPMFSWHARCPRCGTERLKRFTRRDHIEALYANPLSKLQRFIGAPLLYCFRCRLQFYDIRPRLHTPAPQTRTLQSTPE